MMRLVLVGLVVLTSASCATTEERRERAERRAQEREARERARAERQAALPREADENMVRGCTFLGTVRGSSSWGGTMAAAKGIANARKEAIENAAKKGATHYIEGESGSRGSSWASVRAYRCTPETLPSTSPQQPTQLLVPND